MVYMLTNLIRERYLQLNCPQTQYKIPQLQTSERIGGEREVVVDQVLVQPTHSVCIWGFRMKKKTFVQNSVGGIKYLSTPCNVFLQKTFFHFPHNMNNDEKSWESEFLAF